MEYIISLMIIGVLLVLIGFTLLIIGFLRESSRETRVEGGGVIIVGPIPIVFGSSQKISIILLVLAIILTLLSIILFIIYNRGSLETGVPRL